MLNSFSADLQQRTSKKGTPYSRNTVASYVREANALMGWASKDEELHVQKARGGVPVAPKTIVQVLTAVEVQAMIDAAGNQRDKLIIEVLYQTGMRAAELLLLRTSDLTTDGPRRQLRVRGKGEGGQGRERFTFVTPNLYRQLERYASGREGALWVSLRRSPTTGQFEPLGMSGLEHMVGFLGQAAAIKRPVHPHLFRHTCATRLLRKGISATMLKQTMGWTTTQMIDRRYGHLTDSDTYDAIVNALLDR
jgi:integrase